MLVPGVDTSDPLVAQIVHRRRHLDPDSYHHAKQVLSILDGIRKPRDSHAHPPAPGGTAHDRDFDTVDYFTDQSLVPDPHPYFDHLRAKCPVAARNRTTACSRSPATRRRPTRSTRTPSTSRRVSRWRARSRRCRSRPRATTSARSDRASTAPRSRCSSTWSRWIRRDHTDARSLLNRLLTPKRLKENEDFMWRLADRQLDEFIADGPVRVPRRLRQAVLAAGDRRPARRARGGPRGVPRGVRGRSGRARTSARSTTRLIATNPLAVARREVRRATSRSAASHPRDDVLTVAGDREVPGRVDARGRRRRPHRDVPVRRRPGDHRQAARRGAAGARRPARHPADSCATTAACIPIFIEECAADGQPGEERVPDGPQEQRRSATSTCPRAPR